MYFKPKMTRIKVCTNKTVYFIKINFNTKFRSHFLGFGDQVNGSEIERFISPNGK